MASIEQIKAAVWAAQNRTLTSTGGVNPTSSRLQQLVAQVWAAQNRTLTSVSSPAAEVTSVTIDPPGPVTLEVGETQQFTAIVAGTGNYSQAKVWSKVSGAGTVSATGLVAAPSTPSTGDRQGVFRCASVANPDVYDQVTILIPGVPSSGGGGGIVTLLIRGPYQLRVNGFADTVNCVVGDALPLAIQLLGRDGQIIPLHGAALTARIRNAGGVVLVDDLEPSEVSSLSDSAVFQIPIEATVKAGTLTLTVTRQSGLTDRQSVQMTLIVREG